MTHSSSDTRARFAETMRRLNAGPTTPAPAAPARRVPLSVAEFTDRLRSAGHDPVEMLRGAPERSVEFVAAGNIARSGLARAVPFTSTRAEGAGTDEVEGDGLTIAGYGAVFNSETEINSWEGRFIEKIRKGAFRKSLTEQTPLMQFDHGHHPLLGGLPIGTWSRAEEDDHGLAVEGRLYDNWMVLPFRDAIADPNGGVTGMSFRFSVVREEWRDAQGKKVTDDQELFELLYYGAGDRGPITRELIEVKAPEVGPVVWPAYKDTTVGARSADGGVLTIDLAALRSDPRRLADVAALVDAEARRALMGDRLSVIRTRATAAGIPDSAPVVHTDRVRPGSPEGADTERTEIEPHATDEPAAVHPPAQGAPDRTGDSAGEHSSSSQPTGPVNPVERREQMRDRYRTIRARTLALPES